MLLLVNKALNSLLLNNGKQWRTNKTLQRFCYYYYGGFSHLKIKSNLKMLRITLSGLYINSHKGGTLPDAGWHATIPPLKPQPHVLG